MQFNKAEDAKNVLESHINDAKLENYVQQHPMVNKNLTLIVRQLAPGSTGLPIEIYCFSKDKNWVNYEGIQSDILDHCIAILPIFKLSPYQISDSGENNDA